MRLISLEWVERKGFLTPNPRNLRYGGICSCLWPTSKTWHATYHLSLSGRRSVETRAVLYQAGTFNLRGIY